jgi:hypothetical protein
MHCALLTNANKYWSLLLGKDNLVDRKLHQISKRKSVSRLLLTDSQRRKSVSRALLTDFLFGFFCCFLFVLGSNMNVKWFKRCTMHSHMHVLILRRLNHFTWYEKGRFLLRICFPFSICSLQKWKVAIFFGFSDFSLP